MTIIKLLAILINTHLDVVDLNSSKQWSLHYTNEFLNRTNVFLILKGSWIKRYTRSRPVAEAVHLGSIEKVGVQCDADVIRQFSGRVRAVSRRPMLIKRRWQMASTAEGPDSPLPPLLLRKLFPCMANSIKRPFD